MTPSDRWAHVVVVVDDVHTQQALSTTELLLEQGKRVEVLYAVVDCVAPRGVHQAILDATRVARAI